MYKTVFWTMWERARSGWYGRMSLKYVNYHTWNESPVQVWCMIQGAWGWCTGMTQRDGMGREVGGGFRVGNTCTPMVDSCQCMAKPMQYWKINKYNWKKKISLCVVTNVKESLLGSQQLHLLKDLQKLNYVCVCVCEFCEINTVKNMRR